MLSCEHIQSNSINRSRSPLPVEHKLDNIIVIILLIETRLHRTIGKIIKCKWLGNKLLINMVLVESTPYGSMANRARKNSKISI